MMNKFTQLGIGLLFFFFFSQTVTAQKFTISGYVKDKATGEALIGANIYNKADFSGTTSNTYGFYSITLPKDSVTLVVSFVGYKPIVAKIFLDKNIEFNIGLSGSLELKEVVITAEEEIQQRTQMSTITIPIKQIKSLPALMGEVDVLKVLQLLPGVQSGTEGSSGIYVRGGGPDQNLILLDGVPIYNASHLFGFFSVFNADAINNVDLIKGGFPARYGGRLSSVIDISMKEGNNQEFKGSASIGLISSKLTLEGPIKKSENTTYILSGRRTYIDILARPFIKAQSGGDETGGYYFYDLNAKINHKFSNKDRLYLSGYFGNDKAYAKSKGEYIGGNEKTEYKDQFGLQWGNIITAARWNHLFNPKLFSNVTLTYSRYKFKVFEKSKETITKAGETTTEKSAFEYSSGIEDLAAKIDFDFIPNPNHYVRFGINGIRHEFNPGILAFKDSSSKIDTTTSSFNKSTNEFAAYIEDDFKVGRNFKVNVGLHLSGFYVDKQFYTSLQPRLSMRYLLNNGIALKASYAKMEQYIHLLTNGGIGLPTDLWVPATKRVKPQKSTQYAIGIAKTINRTFEVSLEGYYKDMDNLIEYKDGASFTSIEKDWQDKIEIGKGNSYGAEFFIQKKHGKFTGWLGYTLSWTNRKFKNINFGKEYPYRYDRRHDVSVTSVYKIKENLELAAIWVYGTGSAVSLPTKSYLKNDDDVGQYGGYYGSEVNLYENKNDFRMKSYHRLDFSIAWTKQKKRGVRKWTLGVYNVYNRKNPFFIAIGNDYKTDTKKFKQYSLIPFLPSFSYKFDF